MSFKLYEKETGTLPFADYALIMQEAKGKENVLEIGPGYSTLALIEAGCKRIVTCEHDAAWFDIAKERFKDYPHVEVRQYRDTAPIAEADVSGEFDLALVDSPKGYMGARVAHVGQEDCSRLNTCLLALQHAPVVLLHDATRPLERSTLGRLSGMGHRVTIFPGARNGLARIERNENAARPDLPSA